MGEWMRSLLMGCVDVSSPSYTTLVSGSFSDNYVFT